MFRNSKTNLQSIFGNLTWWCFNVEVVVLWFWFLVDFFQFCSRSSVIGSISLLTTATLRLGRAWGGSGGGLSALFDSLSEPENLSFSQTKKNYFWNEKLGFGKSKNLVFTNEDLFLKVLETSISILKKLKLHFWKFGKTKFGRKTYLASTRVSISSGLGCLCSNSSSESVAPWERLERSSSAMCSIPEVQIKI